MVIDNSIENVIPLSDLLSTSLLGHKGGAGICLWRVSVARRLFLMLSSSFHKLPQDMKWLVCIHLLQAPGIDIWIADDVDATGGIREMKTDSVGSPYHNRRVVKNLSSSPLSSS